MKKSKETLSLADERKQFELQKLDTDVSSHVRGNWKKDWFQGLVPYINSYHQQTEEFSRKINNHYRTAKWGLAQSISTSAAFAITSQEGLIAAAFATLAITTIPIFKLTRLQDRFWELKKERDALFDSLLEHDFFNELSLALSNKDQVIASLVKTTKLLQAEEIERINTRLTDKTITLGVGDDGEIAWVSATDTNSFDTMSSNQV